MGIGLRAWEIMSIVSGQSPRSLGRSHFAPPDGRSSEDVRGGRWSIGFATAEPKVTLATDTDTDIDLTPRLYLPAMKPLHRDSPDQGHQGGKRRDHRLLWFCPVASLSDPGRNQGESESEYLDCRLSPAGYGLGRPSGRTAEPWILQQTPHLPSSQEQRALALIIRMPVESRLQLSESATRPWLPSPIAVRSQ